MNITKTASVSLHALSRNKMRSFLTALGIIIGVGAVIAMVSIGQGAKEQVEKTSLLKSWESWKKKVRPEGGAARTT